MSESENLEKLEAKLQTLTTIATIAIFFLIYTYITGQKHQRQHRQVLQASNSRQRSAASALKPSPVLRASDFTNDGKHHLLLAATGSVATIKIPNILRELTKYRNKLSVRLVLTESAAEFLGGQTDGTSPPPPPSLSSPTACFLMLSFPCRATLPRIPLTNVNRRRNTSRSRRMARPLDARSPNSAHRAAPVGGSDARRAAVGELAGENLSRALR